MNRFSILLFAFITTTSAFSQTVDRTAKIVNRQQGAWFGYINQTRFSDRWGMWLDAHARSTNFLGQGNQLILRVGASYYLTDNVRLMVGYAYTSTRLSPSGVMRPEHRPWQQIWWASRSGRLNLSQWARAEQRFNHRIVGDQLGEGYSFNWRFRYNALLQIPIKGETIQPGIPNIVVQNEAFINAGKQIVNNTFDQNRFFVGVSYPFSKQWLGQLGYMNQTVQQPAGNVFVSNNTLRFFLFHNLDLR